MKTTKAVLQELIEEIKAEKFPDEKCEYSDGYNEGLNDALDLLVLKLEEIK